MNRRSFLKKAGAMFALSAIPLNKLQASKPAVENDSDFKKAFVFGMLPGSLSIADRFTLAKRIGLHGVEVGPTSDAALIKEMKSASEDCGVKIHSIIFGGWGAPLSDPDSKIADSGQAQLVDAIKCANALGAESVLLVPAKVDGVTRYEEAYTRSQARLRNVIPIAEDLKVNILVENVWNNFLLSPIEFARYVDELKSPRLQAYFDVGNVLAFGWPEDWILTLGRRIKKVHLKDFKRGPRQFCNLRDGDVNWLAVKKALGTVGYKGYLTCELGGGDEAYLADVSSRMDMIIKQN